MEEKDKKRLRLLIIYRVLIITLFLGIAIYIDFNKKEPSTSPSTVYLFYSIITLIYIISIVYVFFLKFVKDLRLNIYLQLGIDVLLITFLVYFTGSVNSNYSLLYTLVIIYSVIFLGRKGGLIVASASAISYGLLLDLEYYKIIPSIIFDAHDYRVTVEDVFVRILIHIVYFYTIAFLASFFVEQEKKTRHLLEEKETEFAQLDLLFRSIIESVDTGVMTINLQGLIKTFNRAAEEITGFTLRQIENRYVEEIFPQFKTFFSANYGSEHSKSRKEAIINGRRRKKINLGCSISPLKDKNDKLIGDILIFQDITEIKVMEDSLEKSKRLALIGEMAAGLAHEMRNPLASITGSIELLEQGVNLEETDKRLMRIILRGKNQLDSFVRDFLLLARPIPMSREIVDLNEVMEEVFESMKLSKDWSDTIKIKKVFSAKAKTFANRVQVRQIMNNLILNAIQAMPEGGVLSVETALVKFEDRSEYAEIKITDTGVGIDDEKFKKIFEPFFTDKEKGTGLGLTIVGRIVEGYGGKIKIESIVNIGTTCTVWLPVKNEEN
ncbi:MAG: hypothetical protein A2031_05650 [Deltaproteobacteria bacterium RBG_19FT_COMBO_43_11]|nr:MAG: hypothetical protein A2031_05650 [Deltaproteobacteria bacterium RBG_19FT_COMBO_43_11]